MLKELTELPIRANDCYWFFIHDLIQAE